MTNTQNTPVEVIEMHYPIYVEEYSLRPDTGGPGQYRGGCGLIRKLTILEEATVSVSTERNRISPWGLAGGQPGATARCLMGLPGCELKEMPGKFTIRVPRGTTISLETAGGGGFGNPFSRDPVLVQRDVLYGLVSREVARRAYGVVLDEDLELDQEQTRTARQGKIRGS